MIPGNSNARHPGNSQPLKILISAYSTTVREALAELLSESTGAGAVTCVGTPLETLEAIERLRPEVLLLDSRMFGRNVTGILELIRQHQAAMTVIVLSSIPSAVQQAHLLAAGADHVFDLSASLEQLVELIGSRPRADDPCSGSTA